MIIIKYLHILCGYIAYLFGNIQFRLHLTQFFCLLFNYKKYTFENHLYNIVRMLSESNIKISTYFFINYFLFNEYCNYGFIFIANDSNTAYDFKHAIHLWTHQNVLLVIKNASWSVTINWHFLSLLIKKTLEVNIFIF